jgi:hypothetical protein
MEMNIGLIDVDGHNFPNLAIMKLSAWHKSQGDTVSFVNYFEEYDLVYQSKVFTFTPDNYTVVRCSNIVKGGTGYSTVSLPDHIEHTCPDYSIYPHLTSAYGFLTRGCPNKCAWCIVPKKEGQIRANADISEFLGGNKSAILMDNNVLASDHGIRQIEKIIRLRIKVDFNQGLDARLIDKSMAKLLSRVRWLTPLRMSCDTTAMLKEVKRATALLRKNECVPKRYSVYLLVTDIPSALDRAMKLKELNLDVFAQPYIDYSGKYKVTKEQKAFARWVNHTATFKSVEYKNYN